jgi:hypothetical protein
LRIVDRFLAGYHDAETQVRQAFDKYVMPMLREKAAKDNVDPPQIELEITFHKREADLAYESIQALHVWKPDWVAIWNMSFDIAKLTQALERGGFDPAEVYSDPSIPPVFRHYKYREGATKKTTQSGRSMPLPGFDQWHTVECPASWQVVDAMCLYRRLRIANGLVAGGYGLDNILNIHLEMRKLKFKEADHLVSGSYQWHAFMQSRYPIEYCVYNIWDSLSMQMLDDKTGDVQRQLGLHLEHSELVRFPSNPRRIWDDMHFECMTRRLAEATTSDEMRTELDDLCIDLRHHIVTLPSHLVFEEGLKVLAEMPDMASSCYAHVGD